ncbi:MAG: pyrroline-5-carboxylate reductase [Anaerovoracaceae bacterium]|nr:pyrroline-5-carboxylate reductase [Clostridiales bacterium]
MKIGLIGTGNMGGAILRGYTSAHPGESKNCYIYDVNPEASEKLRALTGAASVSSVEEVVRSAELTIIAVKPYHYDNVLPQIAACDLTKKTIMTIAAGITIDRVQKALGSDTPIVRIMPNTPAGVLSGMTAVWKNDKVDEDVFTSVMELLSSFGKAIEIHDEEQVHAVIGASGSSPAYAYMFIDAIARASEKEGLRYEDALVFAAQSVMGAAKMVMESGSDPTALRIAVCSPNGTTIEAVRTLQANGFERCVEEGVHAAAERSREMSRE